MQVKKKNLELKKFANEELLDASNNSFTNIVDNIDNNLKLD